MSFDSMTDFTHNLRHQNESRAIKGVTHERMNIYKTLIYNNINDTLKRAFPISFRLLCAKQWDQLSYGFLQDYQTISPFFYEIPKHFLSYLNTLPTLPLPFLAELMHYEWIELDVEFSNDLRTNKQLRKTQQLIANSSTRALIYQYPVHQICEHHQPTKPPKKPTFLIVYRNNDFKVCFMEANLLSAHLVEVFLDSAQKTETALMTIAQNLEIAIDDTFLENGHKLCQSFVEKNILVEI